MAAPAPAGKRRRWLRILVWAVVALAVLVVAAYFTATSSAFFKGVVLPRVSQVIGARVTVSEAAIHPFREVALQNLKVQAANLAPLITAPEIRVRYHLWNLLHGNLRLDDITLVSPTIELVQNPDGSNNLDPLLKALKSQPSAAKPKAPGKPSPPPQLDLRQLTLRNATLLKIQNYADGRRDVLELTNVNVTLTNLQNGQTARLQLDAALAVEKNPATGGGGSLAASIQGSFQFGLTPDLKPSVVNGTTHLDVTRAAGMFDDFAAFSTALNCEATPTEIKRLDLRFQKAGASLGEVAVSGPLNLEKMEGQLQVKLQGIDRRLLDLAGASAGLDFNSTTVNSTNEITLTKAGTVIAAAGRFNADKFSVTRAGQTTPTLDFAADYAVTVDTTAQTARLDKLTLTGTQNDRALLAARVSQPMSLAWGTGTGGVGDSALDVNVTNLNLADWRPFLGNTVSAGEVNLTMKLLSQQAGKQLGFDLNSQITDLAARVGSNQTFQATVKLQARGQGADFKQFKLSEYKLQVNRQDQPLLTASGSGAYNLADASAEAQVELQASLPGLCAAFPQPGTSVSSGTLEMNGHVTQKANVQTVTGRLTLADFTGQLGKNSFRNLGSAMNVDVRRTPEQVQIKKLDGGLTQSGNAGGKFNFTGAYDTARKTAQLTADLSDFNQAGLRPFLEPLLAGKQLVSIAVNGNASIQYDPASRSAVKADLQVTNLVVHDPAGTIPATPLAATLHVDTTLQKQSADIRQFQIGLTPTARAQNQIQLQGQVDFAQPKAIQGSLKLTSDSLDLTPYYDLFAGGTKVSARAASPAQQQPTPVAASNQEPPPVTLPLKNFTVAADISRLYLREVAITNLQTTVKLDPHQVTVKPFQLTLNGAPVTAAVDLNLGVPGYKYSLALDADQIPFAPLVDSFAPSRQGQLGGLLSAHAQVGGAGVTGANLQKNLTGQFTVGATNLNLSVINIHSSILKSLINVVATIPQLLSNPESGIMSLFSQMTGQGGGLVNELQQSPIQVIVVRGQAGGGRIAVQQASVQSAAFEADAPGDIVLAPVLTNSVISFPVTVSLSQPIAQKLNLAATNSAAGTTYVPLPQFLTMTGTIGEPKTQIKKSALLGLTVKSLGKGILDRTTNTNSPVGGFLNNLLKQVR